MTTIYDAAPQRLDELVSIDEAESIAAAEPKQFAKDQRKVAHYTVRVAKTLKAYRNQIHQLHRDVQKSQLSSSQVGQASTLSPLDAVRYLTPEQFASVADSAIAAKISSASAAEQEARTKGALAISRINESKLLLSSLLDNPRLDEKTRVQLKNALDRFSASAEALGELEGLFDADPDAR